MTSARLLPVAILLSAALAGCGANVRDYLKPPREPTPLSFERSEALAETTAPDPYWWRGLNDPLLDQLIDRALDGNRDVLAAEAELSRARSLARLQGWTLWPRGDATASYTRRRDAVAGFRFPGQSGGGTSEPDDDTDFFSVGLEASWEPDVFGRLRGDVKASRAEAQAAIAARRGAEVAIAAEIAAQYVGYRGSQARLAAARDNAESQRETLRLTEALKEAGRGTRLDVARAREQVAATEAVVAQLEADVAAALYSLSVLIGAGGAELTAQLDPIAPVPSPPTAFGVGTPEELLQRRPDIREAERRLAAAAYRAAERGSWWPRVTLVGGASLSAFSIQDLSSQSAFGFSIGPRIDWPLLDLRRSHLRQRALEAGAAAEYERFDGVVAAAYAEVETSLVALATSRRAAEFAREGALAAREAADLARLRYREGVDSFFVVLDAERRLAEAEDRRAQAEAGAATAYVRLGQALGAGWRDDPGPRDDLKPAEALTAELRGTHQ